ncbi:hypothetical protein BC628DRAFT_1414225 [Trametes gibbosa]|nr:hypothetical protein BC628DRAFT_1414225 [Trametes gibbosa]
MPESFSANNTFVFIADDADLSSISYSGTWAHTVDFIDAYDDTGSEGLPGASATMLFSGYNVAAYAALPDSVQDLLTADPSALLPPNVTVVLDDAPPTRVSVPLALDAPFFAATGLAPDRPHTLAITIDAANKRAAFPFVLDAVAYATTIPPAALATAVPPHRQKALAPSASGRGGAFYTAVVSQAAASAAGRAPVPVGAIVAGVLGGVTLLVCAALAVYLLYARRRRWRRDMAPDPYFMDDPLLVGSPEDKQPLIGRGPPLPSSPQPFAERERDDPFAYPPRASTSRQPSDPASFSAGALTSTPNARPSRRKAEEAGVLSVPRAATYHSDSGIRFTNAGRPISAAEDEHDVDSLDGHESVPPGEDFPPSYSVR